MLNTGRWAIAGGQTLLPTGLEVDAVVLVEDGKVAKAVVDPDEAVNIVRRGHYDYATARAIAPSRRSRLTA